MIEAHERTNKQPTGPTVTLCYDLRKKGRFKATTDQNQPIGFFLERGQTLRDGDCVLSSDGEVVSIIADNEPVITARCDDPHLFARACYHLGNRHVPLQIGEQWLRIQPDHVLEEMLQQLGLVSEHQEAPFEPESGAYGGHHHHHE